MSWTTSDPTTPTAYNDPWQRASTSGTITISYGSDDWLTSPTVPTRRARSSGSTYSATIVLPRPTYAAVAPARLENEGWGIRKTASLAALDDMVRRARQKRQSPKELKARFGHQQMCRIPCYRGVRTR